MEVAVNSIMAGVTDTPALRKIPGSIPMLEVAREKKSARKFNDSRRCCQGNIIIMQRWWGMDIRLRNQC